MDLVVYAPGAGRGHTTRAAAILRRLDADCLVLITDGSPQPLDAHGIPWRRIELSAAPAVIDELAPRVLVVDCFAAGQKGELADRIRSWPFAKVLVWRRLQRPHSASLARPDADGYDLVLVAERGGGAVGVDCEPLLLRDPQELMPRDEARALLGAPDEAPAVVAATAHSSGEYLESMLAAVDLPLLRPAHYPLLELMNGVDGLVGTAGYNLFHEVQACGVPARWVWARGANDQILRCPEPVHDAGELSTWIAGLRPRADARADYVNGAATAARHIDRLLR